MTGGERLEGLDAWRAVLMLGGLLLHATLMKEPTGLFHAIALVSGAFRMGTFFALSGLLAALALARRGARGWLGRRTFQIGVPLAFALAVICPLCTALAHLMPHGFLRRAVTPIDWHHIWFLVALLLYAPLAVLFDRVALRPSRMLHLSTGTGGDRAIRALVLVGLPLVCFALMEATMMAIAARVPELYWAPVSQWRFIIGYAPLYTLGFAIARSARLRDALLSNIASPICILLLVIAINGLWFGHLDETDWGLRHPGLEQMLQLAGSALCPPAVTVLAVRSALRIRQVPRRMLRLAEASFTIYLVHFPIFMILNTALAYVPGPVYLEYAGVLAAGSWLSYRMHTHLVCRSPIAALLLNGKRPEQRAPCTSGLAEATPA